MKLAGISILLTYTILSMNSAFADSKTLTLTEAINIAIKDNPRIKAHNWSIQSKREDVYIARGYLFPNFNIEERFRRTDNPTYSFMAKLNQERFSQEDFIIDSLNHPDPVSDYETSFNIKQPLFVPKIYNEIDITRGELNAREEELQMKKDAVALDVIRTYLMTQTAKEFLSVAVSGLEDAKEHNKLARQRYETGTGLYSDILRTDVAVNAAETRVVEAKSDLGIAKRSLGLVLGMTEPVDVNNERPHLSVDDLNVYIQAATERSDLKALKMRYENSLKAVSLEKSTFIPELGMSGGYQFNDHKVPFGGEGSSYVFALFLRWNLFDATLPHRIKKAQANASEVKERLSGLEKEIKFRVNEAFSRLKEREQNLVLSKKAVKEAEEAMRIIRVRYENDLSPMIDLIDTQLMLDKAKANAVRADNEYFMSIAVLHFQSGLLLYSINNQGEPE